MACNWQSGWLIVVLLVFGLTSVRAAETVSLESLLNEMIDRDAVARFPQSDFRLRQQSSYDRRSKTPDDPEGWFANKDHTDNFVRVETHNGQREWVLMDHHGPGAIVRTWMPFRSVPKDSLIRFYFDDAPEPALEGNVCTLLNGTGLIPYPFAHNSLLSAVSFFPLPYAKHCKVTVTKQPFFFQFTYREYSKDTAVKTFSLAEFESAAPLVEKVGQALLTPQVSGAGQPLSVEATLASKASTSLALPAGPAAVRELSLKLGSYQDPAVTRSVVVRMEVDGKETVWCPLGDFFGTGIGLHPFQGWYRTVAENGVLSCRWVMPYRDSGKISVVNLGDKPVEVELRAKTGPWEWDPRSLYFHATWRGQYPVPTRPHSDWNYVTLQGRGVYVGDTLTVMNPVEKWWGEGDEKIWVDGEDFPSLFGTGTEDYYGYSWGGVSTDFYEHPFHSQPHCHGYDKLNRKTTNERNTQGYSTETRTRALDTMPFGKSLQVDMEVWHWADCDMSYNVATYWYGSADTTSNREPDEQEAARPLVQPPPQPPAPQVKRFDNAVECETLEATASRAGVRLVRDQVLKRYGEHRWSNGRHLFVRDAQVGDSVELRVPAAGGGPVEVLLHATTSWDYGILRFAVNGKPVGSDVDTYTPEVGVTGPLSLGVHTPVDGTLTIRVTVAGANPKAKPPGTFFGLDCVVLNPAKPDPAPPGR